MRPRRLDDRGVQVRRALAAFYAGPAMTVARQQVRIGAGGSLVRSARATLSSLDAGRRVRVSWIALQAALRPPATSRPVAS
jgi:hypothetical protein